MNGGQLPVQNRFRLGMAHMIRQFGCNLKELRPMKALKTLSLLAVTLAVTAGGASAYDYDRGDRIDNREARQAARLRPAPPTCRATKS